MNAEFAQAIERFCRYLRRRYPGTTTAKHYKNDLIQFCQVIDEVPARVTRADITQFVTKQLAAGRKPATVNRRLATLRSFFNFLAVEAENDDWKNPVVWSHHSVKVGHHLPRDLPETAARLLWKAVRQGPVRDQALVALMLDVGLRVGEVATLKVQDFEPATVVLGLAGLRVRGKGNKERRVWLVPETARLVEAWLDERPSVVDDALFITRRRRGFSVRGIQDRIQHYTRLAGLPSNQVSCHRLRHTFGRRMAEAGMPLPSLSHWLGHSQIQTTKIYTDGAQDGLLADYQAAMAELSQAAERQAPESSENPVPTWVDEPDNPVGAAPELTSADLWEKTKTLPSWLRAWVVTFVEVQQVRWLRYHRRARATLWCNQLCRNWEWLFANRKISDFTDLGRADLDAYLSYLQAKGRSASTLNLYRHIFLTFLRFMEEQGIAIAPGVYRVELAKVPDRPPRPLSAAECKQLEQAVYELTTNKSPANAALDRSWFFILLDGGLRLSEMLTLTVGDWNPQERLLTVRYGKGARQRRVPLTRRAAQAIAAHLAQRPGLRSDGALLVLRGKPLSAATVRLRLKAYAAAANVDGVHPHRLRHSYATRLLNTGQMPITTLSKLMGHAKIDDTMHYVALTDQRIQEDYRVAIAPLQETDEFDWDLWNPAFEEAFQSENGPVIVDAGNA